MNKATNGHIIETSYINCWTMDITLWQYSFCWGFLEWKQCFPL